MNAPRTYPRGRQELRSTTSSLYCNHRTQIIGSIKVSWYVNVWHAHLHDCPLLHMRVCAAGVYGRKREVGNGKQARCWASASCTRRFCPMNSEGLMNTVGPSPVRSELWILNTLNLLFFSLQFLHQSQLCLTKEKQQSLSDYSSWWAPGYTLATTFFRERSALLGLSSASNSSTYFHQSRGRLVPVWHVEKVSCQHSYLCIYGNSTDVIRRGSSTPGVDSLPRLRQHKPHRQNDDMSNVSKQD